MPNESEGDPRVWSQRHTQQAFAQAVRCGNRGAGGDPAGDSHGASLPWSQAPLLKATAVTPAGTPLPVFMTQVSRRVRYLFQKAKG